jgi:transposase InsO family protein
MASRGLALPAGTVRQSTEMDQGWAAVIAGAAGAGGAGLGSWATGRAMVKQVREQARDRHAHWLLEQRQEAYTEILAAHDAVMDSFNTILRVVAEQRPSNTESREAWRETNGRLSGCARAMRRVEVVGPERLATLAVTLHDCLMELADTQRRPLPNGDPMPLDKRVMAWAVANESRQVVVSEYSSAQFRSLISELGLRQSMGRTGSCYDNAAAESFFGLLKAEIGTTVWETRARARADVFRFIEVEYNRSRLRRHPEHGYLTPLETRALLQQDLTPAA